MMNSDKLCKSSSKVKLVKITTEALFKKIVLIRKFHRLDNDSNWEAF